MAKLTSEESGLLKRLMAKSEAPDAPPASRHVNVSVDLGDEKQVERAQKLGLLDMFTGDDDTDTDDGNGDDGDAGDGDGEEAPKRRGYF